MTFDLVCFRGNIPDTCLSLVHFLLQHPEVWSELSVLFRLAIRRWCVTYCELFTWYLNELLRFTVWKSFRKENIQFSSRSSFSFLILLMTRRLMGAHVVEPPVPWIKHLCGRHRDLETRSGWLEPCCRSVFLTFFEILNNAFWTFANKKHFFG